MDQGYQVPQAQPKKPKIVLIIIITAILALAIGAGVVYFIMNNQKVDADLNLSRVESKVKKLESIIPAGLDIDKLSAAGTDPASGDQVGESRVLFSQMLTNEEALKALTLTTAQEVATNDETYIAVVRVIDGNWARTGVQTLISVPGGYEFFQGGGRGDDIWNKVDGQWKKVAECSNEGPCTPDNLKAIPLSIISLEERTP